MLGQHIVKSYDKDLKFLNDKIIFMGEQVFAQIESVFKAVKERDHDLAQKVIDQDPIINALEHEIDNYAVRILALRHPVAEDLRAVISALKISTHLERIADYARNVAKKSLALEKESVNTVPTGPLQRMTKTVLQMLTRSLKAYVDRDPVLAREIWYQDEDVDGMYVSYVRELLTYMMENPKMISACIHWLFIAKNLERAGDHMTNISEVIIYLISGEIFQETKECP